MKSFRSAPELLAALLLCLLTTNLDAAPPAIAAGGYQNQDTLSESVADPAAIERVYYDHRTGTKSPFGQAMPQEVLNRLVEGDRHKDAVLLQVYSVRLTPEIVEAEVRRIETTTRAPDVLAGIKLALGGDPAKFARSVARPFVVERILRQRFENDDALHPAQRAEAEKARHRLLGKEAVEGMQESTWQQTPRPAEGSPATRPVTAPRPPATSASTATPTRPPPKLPNRSAEGRRSPANASSTSRILIQSCRRSCASNSRNPATPAR